VETIPDIFRTVGNVSADLCVTAVAARGEEAEQPADAPPASA
jgi:Na+/H+-dicarboxylate symporter